MRNGDGLNYAISVSGLDSAASVRLHRGSGSENGPTLLTFCAPCRVSGGMLTWGWGSADNLSWQELYESLAAFGTYVEIRTTAGPLLRGQVRNTAP